jgi:hypothetical protein
MLKDHINFRLFSATATAVVFSRGRSLPTAATGGVAFPQQGINYRRGAAHPGFHVNRLCRAIFAAGAALHAGIAIPEDGAPSVHFENPMRADLQTHTAARAFVFIEL